MGANASIYGMIRPVQAAPDPLAQYGQVLGLKNMMGQQEMQAMQADQYRRGIANDERLSALFSGGAEPTEQEVMAADPKFGMSYSKSRAEKKKIDAEERRAEVDAFAKRSAASRDVIATMRGDADVPRIAEAITQLWGPDNAAKMLPELFPPDFRFSPEWQQSQITTANELLKKLEPKYQTVNAGGRTELVQTNPSAPGFSAAPIAHTATPDALMTDSRVKSEGALNRGVQLRGQNLTDARSKETNAQGKLSAPQEITGPNGTPILAAFDQRNRQWVDTTTGQPVAGQIGPKLGETAQKQQVGVQNTRNAITEYRDALKNMSVADVMNPAARKRMGTVYNNMLLQAKEAYNLGVLNGPDYQILQDVITDPMTLSGTMTTKKSLDDQAKKLDEIMKKVGAQVTATQSGVGATPPAAAAAPSRSDIDAELRRRGVIK